MFDDEEDDIKNPFEKFIKEFQKMLEGMISKMDLDNMNPEDIMKNINWDDFPKFKGPFGEEFQKNPFVMGFSVNVGPDGKPRIERFGNKVAPFESDIGQVREPLVDILEDENEITLICEVPGVEKEDIKLKTTSKGIEIKAGNSYHKSLKFPAEVIPQKAKAKYKNGILEIKLPKK
ncbi:MAG: Hsp20/alpha crystallin family protein [Candidatus Helarchaeota archaeon]